MDNFIFSYTIGICIYKPYHSVFRRSSISRGYSWMMALSYYTDVKWLHTFKL